MDARLVRAVLAIAALSAVTGNALGASSRSQNFIVSAPSQQLAEEICSAAETFRRDLAVEWLGAELPPWRQPVPITAQVHPQLGAGGVTSFMFDSGVPFGWTMSIQGSRERVLDSVLPHEITHTIFATHFGRPLPRWADEGACTTVEHTSETSKQDRYLLEFLTTDRGIPFNKMFAMTQYPRDILPLYSQGYSLARYLIQQGGKRKFVQYVGDGMSMSNWTAATRKHYGFNSLSDLQVTWVEWVRQGSPNITQQQNTNVAVDMRGAPVPTAIAALPDRGEQPREGAGWQTTPSQNARVFAQADTFERPPSPTNFDAQAEALAARSAGEALQGASSVSRPVSEGWYARKRDQTQAVRQDQPADTQAPTTPPPGQHSIPHASRESPGARHVEHDDNLPGRFEPMQGLQPVPAPPTRPRTPVGSIGPAGYESPLQAVPPPGHRRVLMEWTRPEPESSGGPVEVIGLALHDDAHLHR